MLCMKKYDYLIVGSGLFGATFARLATDSGKRCMVIDKRHHLGGNVYCETVEGINVHRYGPHIFHTSNIKVWEFGAPDKPCGENVRMLTPKLSLNDTRLKKS